MQPQLSDELYFRFRDLLRTRSGLYYPDHKRADLLHGLNSALAAGSHASLAELYLAVEQGGPAWEFLLTHLTIGETYFFRNGAQFDALRYHILPDILARRAETRTLRAWSAGCATGEEPYSLAMTLADLIGDRSDWNASILATDINQQFLARAREGLFGEWSFRETPDAMRARFWSKEQSRWRLRNQIRQMVQFATLNLADASYPSIINGTSMIDLLICRNVTIYFDEQTTRQVVERFYRALTPGGWLIVGHSEPQSSIYEQYEVYNFPHTVIYRKPLSAPLFAFSPKATPEAERARPAAPARARTAPLRPRTAPLTRTTLPPVQPEAPAKPLLSRSAEAPSAPDQHVSSAPASHIPLNAAIGARMQLARQSADRGDWPEAQLYCEQALALDSLWIEAHYLLAQIYEHQGLLDLALASYRRTVYLDRGFVPGLIGLGTIWQRLGRPQEAARSYRTALALLAQLPGTAPVASAAGATAADMILLVNQYLRALS